MINHFGKLFSIALSALALLTTQAALGWGTSPSSGSTYSWNSWGSTLRILFDDDSIASIPVGDRLQVEYLESAPGPTPGYINNCQDYPCVRLHGRVPACIDSTPDTPECETTDPKVIADLNVSIDKVTESGGIYTAGGKNAHVIGAIGDPIDDCEVVYPPPGPSTPACADLGFPAAIGLPNGGNWNKIFPADTVDVQGLTVDLSAGQLLWLAGPLDQPKGPVLRHCFEHVETPDYTGIVKCGTGKDPQTAQGELPPYIGGLLFESTTTNINIGKNATSFAIHVNLLSQTNAEGLKFVPVSETDPIDYNPGPLLEGCPPTGSPTENDFNGDGVTDVRLKYDAGCVADHLRSLDTITNPFALTVHGKFESGVEFEGTFEVLVNE